MILTVRSLDHGKIQVDYQTVGRAQEKVYLLLAGKVTGSEIARLRAETEFWGGETSRNYFQ